MADTPKDAPNAAEEAFLREVDDELRRDELAGFWKRYGRLLIGGVAGGLALYAGFLWWNHHNRTQAGLVGETFDKAIQASSAGDAAGASKQLAEIVKTDGGGYKASAMFAQAELALRNQDLKGATALYEKVSKDESLAAPWRDLALIRQTHVQFDSMKPQDVIARMTALAVKDSPWFGSAGEIKAIALMKMGKKTDAGKLFAEISKTETVPESIRKRSQIMAGLLGIDMASLAKEVKAK